MSKTRPFGVKALVILFAIGAFASFLSTVSLSFPGSFLEVMWRLNPRAREGFDRIGGWSIPLMVIVCLSCVLTTIGLWRGRRWGYWLALIMLVLNLAGSLINFITGSEPGPIIGVPIVLIIVAYLLNRRTKEYFDESA